MKNISYLSRIREMMLRLSFLGIIVSFAFCSHRLDGLKIRNHSGKIIKVKSVSEGYGTHMTRKFIGIEKGGTIIPNGKYIDINNIVGGVYIMENEAANFENLRIVVEYKRKQYEFDSGNMGVFLRDYLKAEKVGVTLEIPTNKENIARYYFNENGSPGELNVRFDPRSQLR